MQLICNERILRFAQDDSAGTYFRRPAYAHLQIHQRVIRTTSQSPVLRETESLLFSNDRMNFAQNPPHGPESGLSRSMNGGEYR